jgi:hypothetical protein
MRLMTKDELEIVIICLRAEWLGYERELIKNKLLTRLEEEWKERFPKQKIEGI